MWWLTACQLCSNANGPESSSHRTRRNRGNARRSFQPCHPAFSLPKVRHATSSVGQPALAQLVMVAGSMPILSGNNFCEIPVGRALRRPAGPGWLLASTVIQYRAYFIAPSHGLCWYCCSLTTILAFSGPHHPALALGRFTHQRCVSTGAFAGRSARRCARLYQPVAGVLGF